jgi:hypothetical protein
MRLFCLLQESGDHALEALKFVGFTPNRNFFDSQTKLSTEQGSGTRGIG